MKRPILRAAERTLFASAILCLGLYGAGTGQAWLFGLREGARLAAASGEGPELVGPSPALPERTKRLLRHGAEAGRAWGRIEVPRLGLEAIVAEGIDPATLRVAVGHVPDTAFPDELGNVALAGHRDSVFRPLRELAQGDLIRLTTPLGDFNYEVDIIAIVGPHRTDLIAYRAERVLTLVTCYPFTYVGRAPQRFVVRARLVQPLPAKIASLPAPRSL